MKFVVDELPYYGELCPVWMMCWKNANENECEHLIEMKKLLTTESQKGEKQ